MDKENLKKSYMLIGPPGIGKSLISQELSKKTGLPIFSIDEIIGYMKDSNRFGFPKIFVNEKRLIKHYKKLAKEYGTKYEQGSELDSKQNEMLKELADYYLFYNEKLKGFNEIKKAFFEYLNIDSKLENAFSALISIYIFEVFTVNVYKIIASKINEPVIFDMPCNFAWFVPNDKIFEEFDIDIKSLNNEMSKILNSTNSILIEPGKDFEERNPETSHYFEFLVNHRKNYKQSDIIISSNDLFFDATDINLKNRSCFNAKSQLKREQLLNKAEVSNICDQIIQMINDLNNQPQ